MVQFIPIVAIPQVFFSGIFPLENMSPWLSNIGYLFPLRYAGHALTNIMIKGQGWSNIWFDVLILFVFIIIFTTMNMIGLNDIEKSNITFVLIIILILTYLNETKYQDLFFYIYILLSINYTRNDLKIILITIDLIEHTFFLMHICIPK